MMTSQGAFSGYGNNQEVDKNNVGDIRMKTAPYGSRKKWISK